MVDNISNFLQLRKHVLQKPFKGKQNEMTGIKKIESWKKCLRRKFKVGDFLDKDLEVMDVVMVGFSGCGSCLVTYKVTPSAEENELLPTFKYTLKLFDFNPSKKLKKVLKLELFNSVPLGYLSFHHSYDFKCLAVFLQTDLDNSLNIVLINKIKPNESHVGWANLVEYEYFKLKLTLPDYDKRYTQSPAISLSQDLFILSTPTILMLTVINKPLPCVSLAPNSNIKYTLFLPNLGAEHCISSLSPFPNHITNLCYTYRLNGDELISNLIYDLPGPLCLARPVDYKLTFIKAILEVDVILINVTVMCPPILNCQKLSGYFNFGIAISYLQGKISLQTSHYYPLIIPGRFNISLLNSETLQCIGRLDQTYPLGHNYQSEMDNKMSTIHHHHNISLTNHTNHPCFQRQPQFAFDQDYIPNMLPNSIFIGGHDLTYQDNSLPMLTNPVQNIELLL